MWHSWTQFSNREVPGQITKDRRWRTGNHTFLPCPRGEATISVSVNLGQGISEGITFEMKGECRLITQWGDFIYSLLLHWFIISFVGYWPLSITLLTVLMQEEHAFIAQDQSSQPRQQCCFCLFFSLCFKIRETGMWRLHLKNKKTKTNKKSKSSP